MEERKGADGPSYRSRTGKPMPAPHLRGPYKGPKLKQLQLELREYMKQLTALQGSRLYIHRKK